MEMNGKGEVHAFCLSSNGRVRPLNEDRCFVDEANRIFIVSDGIGGNQAGEVAAEAVVQLLPRMLIHWLDKVETLNIAEIERNLKEIILKLSQQIQHESAMKWGFKGMGATLVLAWIRDEWLYIAHLGDSRAYLLHGGKLEKLTDDHSVIALLLKHGDISLVEAKNHPARGRLSRFVGMEGEVFPDVRTIALQSGDRVLLCTDGVTGMLEDNKIEAILTSAPQPETACQTLVKAANEAGGKDNITALVVDYVSFTLFDNQKDNSYRRTDATE